jgi:hypothetical protein
MLLFHQVKFNGSELTQIVEEGARVNILYFYNLLLTMSQSALELGNMGCPLVDVDVCIVDAKLDSESTLAAFRKCTM